jgi:hypothetical protein
MLSIMAMLLLMDLVEVLLDLNQVISINLRHADPSTLDGPTRQPWTGRPVGPCRESDAA